MAVIAPVLYRTSVVHVRHQPRRIVFRHRSYLWLVDLDDLPALPRVLAPFARFDASRAEFDRWLARHGVDLGGGRVLMLANARVAGYVFNPITVYWCYRADGEPACVVAEVNNTYGGSHRYLLHPDTDGRATATKWLYVSPFITVDGEYRLRLPEPGEQLLASVALRQHDAPVLTAVLRGTRRPATTGELLRLLLRYPLAPLRGTVHIRLRGIGLWLRGLPVIPRDRTPDLTPDREESLR